jgi:hypothetical protein
MCEVSRCACRVRQKELPKVRTNAGHEVSEVNDGLFTSTLAQCLIYYKIENQAKDTWQARMFYDGTDENVSKSIDFNPLYPSVSSSDIQSWT